MPARTLPTLFTTLLALSLMLSSPASFADPPRSCAINHSVWPGTAQFSEEVTCRTQQQANRCEELKASLEGEEKNKVRDCAKPDENQMDAGMIVQACGASALSLAGDVGQAVMNLPQLPGAIAAGLDDFGHDIEECNTSRARREEMLRPVAMLWPADTLERITQPGMYDCVTMVQMRDNALQQAMLEIGRKLQSARTNPDAEVFKLTPTEEAFLEYQRLNAEPDFLTELIKDVNQMAVCFNVRARTEMVCKVVLGVAVGTVTGIAAGAAGGALVRVLVSKFSLVRKAVKSGKTVAQAVQAATPNPPAAPSFLPTLSADASGSLSQASISVRDFNALSHLNGSARIKVSLNGSEKTMTVDELTAATKTRPHQSVQLLEVLDGGAAQGLSPAQLAAIKGAGNMPGDGAIFSATIDFASGQQGSFSGTRAMLAQLMKDPAVKAVEIGEGNPYAIPLYRLPAAQRVAGYKPATVKFAEVPAEFISTSASSDIAGMPVFHGTVDIFANSVRQGPRNLGSGFGGRGLYVATKGDANTAVEFAAQAAKEYKGRLEMVGTTDPGGIRKPVVLQGVINPNKEFKVGTFTVDRYATEIDLKHGILPPDWDKDAVMRQMMEQNFDILDIRTKDLAIADRILIIHERAGTDAVIWTPAAP